MTDRSTTTVEFRAVWTWPNDPQECAVEGASLDAVDRQMLGFGGNGPGTENGPAVTYQRRTVTVTETPWEEVER